MVMSRLVTSPDWRGAPALCDVTGGWVKRDSANVRGARLMVPSSNPPQAVALDQLAARGRVLPRGRGFTMDPQSARARGTSLTCLGVHDHACLFDGLEAERLELTSAFLRIGLARGERCLYAADEDTAGRVMPYLRAAGVDVGQALASGALAVEARQSLEPGEVLASLEARIEAALGDGFTALRIVGPATWTLARGSGLRSGSRSRRS